MKRYITIFMSILLMSVLFAGCGAAKYEMTGALNNMTVKVNDVEDGAYAESFVFGIGKKPLHIESELTKGKLQLEIASVINMADADDPADYQVVEIVETVTLSPGDVLDIELPKDDYMILVTAIGNTDGSFKASY